MKGLDLLRFPSPVPPAAILAAWLAAGQWGIAESDAGAWLLLIAALSAATLVPLPGRRRSPRNIRRAATWLGWAAVMGLIAVSR